MVADVTAPKKNRGIWFITNGTQYRSRLVIMGASVVVLSKNLVFIIASSTMLFYALLVLLLIQETMPKRTDKEEHKEKESGQFGKL